MDDHLSSAQAAQLGRLVDVFPEARELGDLFDEAGHELYLVGGTVRDALLSGGDEALAAEVDLDFATSARPEDSATLLQPWGDALWTTGVEFGTVSTVRRYDDRPDRVIEVTTYRSDDYAPGSRHPEVTFGDNLEDDLARRDFTVNAMAVRVPEFRFVDPFGGLSDLHARRLRTPQDPGVSFGDDPLRMVRLARFAARFAGEVNPDTRSAAIDMADELATISAERIRDELVKLLAAKHPDVGLQLLVDTGLDRHVIPELRALSNLRDPLHRHKDVWAHTLAVIDNAMALEPDGPDPILRLAALLHDIGKPDTREIHADGSVSFHHHDVVGARMTRHRMRELAFDKATTRAVSELVRMHLRFHTYKMGWTDAAVRRYVRDAGELLERLNLLTRADVTTGNPRRAREIQERMDDLEERIEVLAAEEELAAMRPPIDGNQVMAHTGMQPGPLVGRAWEWLLELRLEAGPMDEGVAFTALDHWWEAVREDRDPPAPADIAADLLGH